MRRAPRRIPPSSLHLAHFHTRVGPFEYPPRAFLSLGTRRRVFAPANYIADVEAWRSDIDLGRRRRNGMMRGEKTGMRSAMTGENVLRSIVDGEPTRPNDSSSFRSSTRLRLCVARCVRFHTRGDYTDLVDFVLAKLLFHLTI